MPSLYICSPQAEVRLEHRHIVVRVPAEKHAPISLKRIPMMDIDRVILMGATRIGSPLLRKWMDLNIPIYFLKRNGKFQGASLPYHEGDVLLRISQFQQFKDETWNLRNAKIVVHAKLRNQRRVLQKVSASKESFSEESHRQIRDSLNLLHHMSLKTMQSKTIAEVRGYEGMGAASYFRGFQCVVPEPFQFTNRARRPPTDPVNALLSLTYSMLTQEIRSHILAAGLESGLGILHQPSHGRPTLALDLLEPFRAPVADMLVLRLLGLGILQVDDFECHEESGGTHLKEQALRKYFRQYEMRVERWFKTKKSQSHTTIRTLLQESVADYKRAVRTQDVLHPYLMP